MGCSIHRESYNNDQNNSEDSKLLTNQILGKVDEYNTSHKNSTSFESNQFDADCLNSKCPKSSTFDNDLINSLYC